MELSGEDLWGAFALDPRDPANGGLRASDQDREVVRGLLATAYADGRLDREEFDERSDRVAAARLLGDVPAIVDDLVPVTPATGRSLSCVPLADRADVAARAQRRYESDRREALLGFLGPSLICVVVWAVVMYGGFFWPGFVIAGTGINLIRTLVRRQDIVEGHVRRLEKKQAKQVRQLEGQPEAKPPTDDAEDPT
ncbi:hypothetical protein NSZ01_04360 [Nocardioides szechwanensis]|uniref:DUF1707 domain-containing protein n=1 Tax=Nocardioides szechwanensis TaxID=1005944 RepID=A0A1G9WDL8_9ACTN|nr:DUF1707 domain-containing protein [Nocardioides szechwanensis]GEP32668.1 hypothetical protein NSZ01_04360 [Nocardioides szechwanensis]SDM82341.1 protein of unknown function [Nocardioides szechwanensis]